MTGDADNIQTWPQRCQTSFQTVSERRDSQGLLVRLALVAQHAPGCCRDDLLDPVVGRLGMDCGRTKVCADD